MQNSKYPINIAIVGMAVKLPKADTLDDFWNNIVNKIDTIFLSSFDRFDIDRGNLTIAVKKSTIHIG